jgi:hypothetical protein
MEEKITYSYTATLLFFLVAILLGFLLHISTIILKWYSLPEYTSLFVPLFGFIFVLLFAYVIFTERIWHAIFFVLVFACSYLYAYFLNVYAFAVLLLAFVVGSLYSVVYIKELKISSYTLAALLFLSFGILVGIVVVDSSVGFSGYTTYHDPRLPIDLSGEYVHCCDETLRNVSLVLTPRQGEYALSGIVYELSGDLDSFDTILFTFQTGSLTVVTLDATAGEVEFPHYVSGFEVQLLSSDYQTRYDAFTGYYHSSKAVYSIPYAFAFFEPRDMQPIRAEFMWYFIRYVAILFVVVPISFASFYILSMRGVLLHVPTTKTDKQAAQEYVQSHKVAVVRSKAKLTLKKKR